MAESLKAHFDVLAHVLDANPESLHSIQRQLVAEGKLPATPGRGPGSGVKGTQEMIARFVVLYLGRRTVAEAGALYDHVAGL